MLPGRGDDRIEDLIQDTFTTAFRRFDSYDGRASHSTWLFGILRNVARNHNRGEQRRIRRRAVLAQEHELGRRPPAEHDEHDRVLASRMLDGFLAELDADKRAVFVLAELEGRSGREIAEVLDINANTVNTRLRAARVRFCAHFELPHSRSAIRRTTRPLRERPEPPPPEARQRTRALLLANLGNFGSSAATTLGAAAAIGLSKSALIGLALGLALVLAAGAAVLLPGEPDGQARRGPARAREALPAAVGAPVPAEVSVESGPPPGSAAAIPVPPAVKDRPVKATRPSSSPDPSELLRQARAALVEADPNAALRLLDRIDRIDRIDGSGLRSQRDATRVAALCQLGRAAEAEAVTARLADEVPDSALLPRLAHACW